jgi:hypothetical protein
VLNSLFKSILIFLKELSSTTFKSKNSKLSYLLLICLLVKLVIPKGFMPNFESEHGSSDSSQSQRVVTNNALIKICPHSLGIAQQHIDENLKVTNHNHSISTEKSPPKDRDNKHSQESNLSYCLIQSLVKFNYVSQVIELQDYITTVKSHFVKLISEYSFHPFISNFLESLRSRAPPSFLIYC